MAQEQSVVNVKEIKKMIYLYVIQGIILAAAGIEDVRKKEIHILYILGMFVVAIISIVINPERNLFSIFGGLSIGLCMIGLSVITEEQIGRGDGLAVSALGLMLGARTGLTMLCMASLFQAVVSVGLLISKKGNKKTKLPFVPAICAGYIGSLMIVL